MHCFVCICLTLLQLMLRPGSRQVSSAAASDVEMEGGIEQQHMLSRTWGKRPPEDYADHEWKRQKVSDSAGQHSSAITEIGRELNWCIEVNIEVLKAKEIEPEEVIKLLHSTICQCKAQTLVQQLDNIREEISGDCKRNCRVILY